MLFLEKWFKSENYRINYSLYQIYCVFWYLLDREMSELAIEKGPISRDECLHIMTSALRVTLVLYALDTIKWLRARNKGKASGPTSK